MNPRGASSVSQAVSSKNDGVVLVQYGNYAETVRRFSEGGDETYFAQRYSVDVVERLPRTYGPTTVVTVDAPAGEEVLPSGVRCIGLPEVPWKSEGAKAVIASLRMLAPAAAIIRFPSRPIVDWCLREGVRVFPLLADSFQNSSLRERFRSWRLARILNDSRVEYVANHQLDSCRDLVRIGVSPKKILPWDWPKASRPSDQAPKSGPATPGLLTVAYAGKVIEAKGVGDLIRAVALLNKEGLHVRATIAGGGEIEHFRGLAKELGVADEVEFAGLVPHREATALMRRSDVVVVPSRHEYGEGLPMTIFDALTSRSPLIISDHPMLVAPLKNDPAVSIFPEKDAPALARALRRLAEDPAHYRSLSEQSETTWQRLQIPLMWGDMVERWLSGTAEDLAWLSRHTLAARNES